MNDYERERRHGVRNAGGCLWMVIFSLPLWALIIVAVVAAYRSAK